MNFMKRNKFYLLLTMMICICWGCKSKNMNSITSEEAESTITGDNIVVEANNNESREESPEESAVKLSDFINPEGNTIFTRFITPKGYKRVETAEGSFADFIGNYPLEPDGTPVYYFDKREKGGDGHAAVFSMEVGEEDLQQCADSIMRIYAEYLYKSGNEDRISFKFVDGFVCDYNHWKQGYRVKFADDKPYWEKKTDADNSEETFKKYLRIVFAYSSTLSMEKEARPTDISELQVGDIFIKGGSPGHVVMVADICENEAGEKAFLLAQGFMPAQSFHIIKNPAHSEDPWYYESEVKYPFRTQSYTFDEGSLRRLSYLDWN
nr:DUF4846 domain-containing protein [uncultured Lachnoanaerobaculum sp.]